MVEFGLAYQDLMTGATTEASEIRGRLGFAYGGGEHVFETSRVAVEFVYTPDAITSWAIRFPVEPAAFAAIMPLLTSLGTTSDEVLNLPADEYLEVTMATKVEVLARLSPQLVKLDDLAAMFQVDGLALMNLDNYEDGALIFVERLDETT